MKILVVDKTLEQQQILAAYLAGLDKAELEYLDVEINFRGPEQFRERINECDVLILGAHLGEAQAEIARSAKSLAPQVEIILYVPEQEYLQGAYRLIRATRARKILPENARREDILQELVNIHANLVHQGELRPGKLIVLTQAKGGLGATTITAGLGELSAQSERTCLLWDMDFERHGLSTVVLAGEESSRKVEQWNIDSHFSRADFRQALHSAHPSVSVLSSPRSLARALELYYDAQAFDVVERILQLAKSTHENVIVDTQGRLNPATAYLMQQADSVVVVVDDSLMGLAGFKRIVQSIRPICGTIEKIKFLRSGVQLPLDELKKLVELSQIFPESSWDLPNFPFDPSASRWPGRGQFLTNMIGLELQQAFAQAALQLDLIEKAPVHPSQKATQKIVSLFSREKTPQEGSLVRGGKLAWQRVMKLAHSS